MTDLLKGIGCVRRLKVRFGRLEELNHMLVAMLAATEVKGVTKGEKDSCQEGESDREKVEQEVFEKREEREVVMSAIRFQGETFQDAGDNDCYEGREGGEAHPVIRSAGGRLSLSGFALEIVDLILNSILKVFRFLSSFERLG